METAPYDELELALEDGDRLLLYTDGLIEAANAEDDFFGQDRVEASLAATRPLPPEAAADALLGAMDAWSGQPAGDDLTIVLLDFAVLTAHDRARPRPDASGCDQLA